MLGDFKYRVKMTRIFANYLCSPEWARVRQKIISRDKKRCVDCGKRIIEGEKMIHHNTYENWGKGNWEEIYDCILLCTGCHRHRHANMIVPWWASRNPDDWGELARIEPQSIEDLVCL